MHGMTGRGAQRGGVQVAVPEYSYGDYAQAAQARGLAVLHEPAADVGLQWACEPASPLGDGDLQRARWRLAPDMPDTSHADKSP